MTGQAGSRQTALSLPKGGGAIQGIGETFQADLFSGTGNFSLPIALSPGRNGFGPKLSLAYSSGNGNGIFGLGWQLALPRVTRKSEKGLPHYDDSDVFVMSGSEDLVPLLSERADPTTGRVVWVREEPSLRESYAVFRYRPRTEGVFARIERWVHGDTRDTHWRTITHDNVTSVFGATPASRLADPEDPKRVYEWLLDESVDALGNHIRYEYAADHPSVHDDGNLAARLPETYERRRVTAQRYIRRIYYGNLPERQPDDQGAPITYPNGSPVGVLRGDRRYVFEVVFDYGDWDAPTVTPHPDPGSEGVPEWFGASRADAARPAPVRADRFSHFRAGFDVRTLRRCHRVLMFHHFAELGAPTLVRSTDFAYRTDPDTQVSLLIEATVTGYQRDSEGNYRSASMPPVSYSYSAFKPHEQRYRPLAAAGGMMPTLSLADPNMALVDLYGDGLPGVLQSTAAGFQYWRNLGEGMLDRPRTLAQVPAGVVLDQIGVGFGDMAGNGIVDLLVHSGPMPGYFETTVDGAWARFTPYTVHPEFTPQERSVRLLDLTGDGRLDAMMTRDDQFLWFPCLGAEGFGPPQSIPRVHDPDQFPGVHFDDPSTRVRLADMTGDGLSDIVMVHDGRVDYWPNLGYGRFGKRVAMAGAPLLGPDFDPERLFLADLNGTGCADLVYVESHRVQFWFNQSGNAWSERNSIVGTPTTSASDALVFADIFGSGTGALLWTRGAEGVSGGHYKALDFCGGVKPYLLVGMDNNIGATRQLSYAASTRYFLADRKCGLPWLTPLPFPVQVVDKVEFIDRINGTRQVRVYRYHHGYYDGRERDFCGFGRVDQFDIEAFENFSQAGLRGATTDVVNSDGAYLSPPVETRSWFHTGLYNDTRSGRPYDHQDLTTSYRREYYQEDPRAEPLEEHRVIAGDSAAEAYRAMRGAPLRSEVYAHDASDKADHPYLVHEYRYRVVPLQPRAGNRHAVYFRHRMESLSYHYERDPSDPRVGHELTLEVDGYGNPRRQLSIAYGRRREDPDLPIPADRAIQGRTLMTYTEIRYTNAIDDPLTNVDEHRVPLPCETSVYELTGFTPQGGAERFAFGDFEAEEFAYVEGAEEIGYEEQANPTIPQKRLIERTRNYFRRDDLVDLLPLGRLEPLALAGEVRTLAWTSALCERVFGDRIDDTILRHCGYVRGDAGNTWWIPARQILFSPNPADTPAEEKAYAGRHFHTPCRDRDVFGNTAVTLWDQYDLLPRESIDAVGNRTLVTPDYRALQARAVTDPNGNREEIVFDSLGLIVGHAVMGKAAEALGDSLSGFAADLTVGQRDLFLTDPSLHADWLLGSATTRWIHDLDRFRRERRPACCATLTRETHVSDPTPIGGPSIRVSISHLDGAGREVQSKIRVGAGTLDKRGAPVDSRWIGSGWRVFNNKGNAVKRFEPFFDDTHEFRDDRRVGVSATLFYDPLQRVVATLHPDRSWEKTVFGPWRQATWDRNDTALVEDPKDDQDVGRYFQALAQAEYLPTWYGQRNEGQLGPAEQATADKTAGHANTPSIEHADALGRTFLAISLNRIEQDGAAVTEPHATRVILDIEGNLREVVDAAGRVAARYDYDILGTRVHQSSMEAGERWMFRDTVGQLALAWDSRGHRFRTSYDPLRRPVATFLRRGSESEAEISRTIYGEQVADAEAFNLRGQVAQHFDQAGILWYEQYDFKGNPLIERRQLVKACGITLDWSREPELAPEIYLSRTAYDAVNRPVAVTLPCGSIVRSSFNSAGLLDKLEAQLRGAQTPTSFITRVDYDAKGQRTAANFSNGTTSRYTYDALTTRVERRRTLRGGDVLQDLVYHYDPVGNITRIQDDSQQALYFDNQVVMPGGDYTYDAVYRLRSAEGREHVGQGAHPAASWNDAGRVRLAHPNDGQAMRRYREWYTYDPVGNLQQVVHQAANGNWARRYAYGEASLLEPERISNRLSRVMLGDVPPESYSYDAHGSMVAMPHLAGLHWDAHDRLCRAELGGGGVAHFAYDAAGHRVRKLVKQASGRVDEWIRLGTWELFRRRDASGAIVLERETLHVMDESQRIALVETRTQGDEPGVPVQLIRYQFGNHLGSSTLELDGAGRIVSYEEYYPYGGTSYQAGRSAVEVGSKRYRYSGMERDEETGLNHHGARYYAPWLGRWISSDPIGIRDGTNTYCSFHDNPLSYKDPGGLQNQPHNFVEYASSVRSGLERMAELGLSHDREFGLARESASGKLMILSGGHDSVHFGNLEPIGHSHTASDTTAHPSHGDMELFSSRNVKEHWIFGKEDGWARVRYDAKSNTFDVLMKRGRKSLRFTVRQNPAFDPTDRSPYGQMRKWKSGIHDIELPERSNTAKFASTRLPWFARATAYLETANRALGVAGIGAVGGEVAKHLHEGRPGRAAVTAGVAGAAMFALKRYPAAMPLAVAAGVIGGYDDQVKARANRSGAAVDDFLGSDRSVVGGVVAANVAVAGAAYNGVIKPVGTGLGEGAAVAYIRLTSDEYTLQPWKSAWWPW